MTAIKQLAGQTLWYGGSNIAARFLNYLLTPLLTYLMADHAGMKEYGDYSLLYVWIAIVNIVFTYGFETGYFRFSNKEGIDKKRLFETAFGSLIISSLGLALIFSLFRTPINDFLQLGPHPEYIVWVMVLIALDAVSAIPFAKLRQENRPRKYAFVKVAGILVNMSTIVLMLVVMPGWLQHIPGSAFARWYNEQNRLGFLILANLLQNIFVFLALFGEWKQFKFRIDTRLWQQLLSYSTPMIIVGLAGMVNEVLDRQMLARLLPLPQDESMMLVGIYSANYKLAIVITLFIQAFRMAAEPFFFNQSRGQEAPVLYARVMKWFVITLCVAFLCTALYLDVWKYMVGPPYRSGLGVVPILLGANICLGVYYNLSVWYKLTDRMRMGMYITLAGAVITLVGNYIFIPYYGYYAAAWTTFTCYAFMMVLTYLLGQKYYPVPYAVKKLLSYMGSMVLLYLLHRGVVQLTENWQETNQFITRVAAGTVLLLCFVLLVVRVEQKELRTLPLIGKWLK